MQEYFLTGVLLILHEAPLNCLCVCVMFIRVILGGANEELWGNNTIDDDDTLTVIHSFPHRACPATPRHFPPCAHLRHQFDRWNCFPSAPCTNNLITAPL